MKWTWRILIACLFLTAGLLSIAYGLGGLWPAIPALLAIAGIWAWASPKILDWTAPLGFLLFTIASAVGLYLFSTPGLILPAMAAALAAWDLDHFSHRAQSVQRVEEAARLERSHLLRLGAVIGVGVFLGAAALLLRVSFSFGIFFLLGLLAIIGLTRAVIFLKRSNGPQHLS
jgi:hypothetical protein